MNKRTSVFEVVLVAAAFWIALWFGYCSSRSASAQTVWDDELAVRWVPAESSPEPASGLLVWVGDAPIPVELDVSCAPGVECVTAVPAPRGCHPVRIAARSPSTTWSAQVGPLANPHCTIKRRFDVTGDGLVTTEDFQWFLRAFSR